MADRGVDGASTAPTGGHTGSGRPGPLPGPRLPGYSPAPQPPGPADHPKAHAGPLPAAAEPVGRHRAPRLLRLGGLALALGLLFVAAVQALLLSGVSADLRRAQGAQRRVEAVSAQQQRDLATLAKRIKSLEARTAGTLNSTAVAKQVLPSVFRVRAGTSTGTAFAFGRDAGGGTLLVTNYHVVRSAIMAGITGVTIERSARTYPATIDRTDQGRDLVILHAAAKFVSLPAARGRVEPGDPVIVVGAPLGLDETVTIGVVSALRDDVKGLATRVIQFDAALSPGNSGGPVINAKGQVIGVAQAKIVASGAAGLGLAVPIGEVCKALIAC